MTDAALTLSDKRQGLFRSHAILAVCVGLLFAISTALSQIYDLPIETDKAGVIALHFLKLVPKLIILVLVWRILHLTYVQKSQDRFADLRSEVRGFLTDRDRMVGGFLASALVICFLLAFGQLKSLVPIIQPFSWDVNLAELDRVLHFGVDPYRLAHGIFGWDVSVTFFTGMYNIWLLVAYFALFGACFMRIDHPARMQFLIASVLTWGIGGNLVATAFSSAGPVYYANLGLGETFRPLIDLLKTHAETGIVTVVDTQNLLWKFYTSSNGINAISAFPSMHVASSTLMAFFGYRIAGWVGVLLTGFAVIIMIGSVLLGWHYAVDGYVGALIAAICWKLSGWLIRSPIGPFRTEA